VLASVVAVTLPFLPVAIVLGVCIVLVVFVSARFGLNTGLLFLAVLLVAVFCMVLIAARVMAIALG
jgi:hypothetical protein